MKKSRIAKLALMGASITALAATLTTSTYAWYVSNQKADVATTTGSTAAASSDGSISLSTSGKYGEFYKQISLGDFSGGLKPVGTEDGKTFKELEVSSNTATATKATTVGILGYDTANASDAAVYCYQFFILADADVTVTPSIKITNTNDTYPKQINLGAETSKNVTNVGGVQRGQQFTVNALNALTMTTFSTTSTTAYASGYTWATAEKAEASGVTGNQLTTDGTTTENSVGNVIKTKNTVEWSLAKASVPLATGGAQAYYTEITGNTLSGTPATTNFAPTGMAASFNLDANRVTLLTYYLFLDGADPLCFNACETQSLSVDFSFQAANRS